VHSGVQQFSLKFALGPGSHCSLESSIPFPHTTSFDENTWPDWEIAGFDLDCELLEGFGSGRVTEGVLDRERDEETEAFPTTPDRVAVELIIAAVERETEVDEEAPAPPLRLRLRLLVTELTFREAERE